MNMVRFWLFAIGWLCVGASTDHTLPYYFGWRNAVLYWLAGLAFTLGLCVTSHDR